MHARLLLQIADHAEKVLGLRVAARTKHTDQALRRRASCYPEFFKADRRLDVVAQDYLAGLHVAGEHRVDALAQKRLGKFRVALDVVMHQFLEAFGSCHLRFPSAHVALASFVVLPISDRRVDVALLPLLRAARQILPCLLYTSDAAD